jgi:hypothetical protein
VSSPDVVAAQALRLRRRMTWSQLALSFVAGLVMIGSLNALAEGLGVAPRDELVGSLDDPVVVVGALALYTLAAAALSWLLARGDVGGALKRFALVFSGGLLLVALAAVVGSSHGSSGGGGGSSDGGGRRRRSRPAGPRGVAMTICDPALATAVFGGAPLDGPVSGDLALIRRSSSCHCTGDAGTVRLTVYPLERAGRSASATPLIPCAIARDETWLVRVLARAADGHAVDETALQALADDALARLQGVTGERT